MFSRMSTAPQPRTPWEVNTFRFSPASLLSGVALARTLDAVDGHFLFIRQQAFQIHRPTTLHPDDWRYILHNGELKYCKRLYYELRSRVSPEIEVLFDPQSSHPNKERVWNEIYHRIGFEVTNPYRFRHINPHRHFYLNRAVRDIARLEMPQFYPNIQAAHTHEAPWEDGGFTSFKIRDLWRVQPGGDTGNADNNTSPTISDSKARFYDPVRGWVSCPNPARNDNRPRPRPRPRYLRRFNISPDTPTKDRANRVDESDPSADGFQPNPEDDVFSPPPRTCAVCDIIFKANTFISEVHLNVKRGVWREGLLRDYPQIVHNKIRQEWASKNPEFVAEQRRGYHPNRYQQYGRPMVDLEETRSEVIAIAILDFIGDRVRDAGLD
ncbi:hypothetical protein F4814DRAFT_445145 [Daldinia grandis]|nr:hypothetical protein F4814DRAFT_445145 [Daldinia grandis]